MRVEYDPDEEYVFAVDPERNTVTLQTTGWRETEAHREEPFAPAAVDIDARTNAVAERLVGPPVHVVAIDAETGDRTTVGSGDRHPFGPQTVVKLSSTVRVLARPERRGWIERRDDATVLTFDEPTRVSIAWASRIDLPERTVRLPRTLDGVAEYVTLAGAAAEATTPDRSWPNARDHPPKLRYGARRVPEEVHEDRPETGIELLAPREKGVAGVLPLAPLAYYLGAEVRLVSNGQPRVVLPGGHATGERVERLGETVAAADRAASRLLRRVFYLDCLVRCVGPYGNGLARFGTLPKLGLDADRLYEASLAERVRSYLDAPFDEVREEFPTWHLGVHLDPTFERAATLPTHLDRLSDVYNPESAELTIPDRIEWSLEQSFVRGPRAGSRRDDPPVVDPAQRARTVGWAGPRVALGAFNCFPEAIAHRERYTAADDPISVVVVNNAVGMFEEHQRVVANYESRVERSPIMEVEARSMLSPAALADVFESRTDLVHFVGHCDEAGLRCPGECHLDTATLDDSRAATFVLNACGSFEQGRELIRNGSVAGVVTLVTAKDRTATAVGVEWSHLLANGWCVERALDVARCATDSPGNYVAVGDGRFVLTELNNNCQAEIHATSINDDEYLIETDGAAPRGMGTESHPWPDHKNAHLSVETRKFGIQKDILAEEIRNYDYKAPVVIDGEIVWDPDKI